jgi:hypothetical protein
MQLAIPRYTQKALPKYRYVPTVTPHPVIDPKGHSYQKVEEKISFLPPEKWMQNEHYLYGLDLFNHGFWWEAHEAWEGVWMTTQKTDLVGLYLQGLIQFSAALLKLYSGSKKGFDNLFKESQKKLLACLDELNQKKLRHLMGLDLQEWLNRVNTFFGSIEGSEGETIDALHFASFPALLVENKSNSHESH